MTALNTIILHVTSAMGVTTITSLMALTTYASIARFF